MTNYSGYTDNDLLHAIKSGDLGAFNEFYNRYAEGLVQYVYQKFGDLEESKDIVQEIFVNIWIDRKKIYIHSSIAGYLYKVARNKSLNIVRKQKIKSEYVRSLALYLQTVVHTQEEQFHEKDQSEALQDAIKVLPPKMREVFELRYRRGMSNEQVAKLLGISTNTVSTHMKRALREIRKHLAIVTFIQLLIHL